MVVCPEVFRRAAEPWLEYRARQGHVVTVVSNTGTSEQIRLRIRDVAKGGRLRFVVLIGDANPGLNTEAAEQLRCVPVHLAKAEVNVLWNSEPHIATDNYYADLDDDKIPDVAVGRLTADTPDELRQITAKVIAYERSNDFGQWRRRLNMVAGVGGFGPLADTVLESAAKYFITQNIPADYRVSMTYAGWRSPYCPDPRLFRDVTLRQLNQGAWFWVYIGHGFHRGLDRVRTPAGNYHILSDKDMPKLHCEPGTPIAMFLSCYTGAFDATTDCMAELMLREQNAPVAVLAGSRVTMPYAMTVLATGLMDQCFKHRCPSLGEAVLGAKRAMMKEPGNDDPQRAMLDAIAAVISPAPNRLAVERAEHLLLFNLIGDPLLRLRYPKPIVLEVPRTVTAGESVRIAGSCPIDGHGVVELVVSRDRMTFKPPPRSEYPRTPDAWAEFQEVYRRANDRRLESTEVTVADGRFEVRLDVPEDARGECNVRVFVTGTGDFASGAADVEILYN